MEADRQQQIVEALKRLIGATQNQAIRQQIEGIISELNNLSGDIITVGNITDSTGVAIGRNIQQIIAHYEFPEDLLAPIHRLINEFKPTIFLSYARADDEPFVKRLYDDLIECGFKVWWDRVNMLSRGNTFLKEIGDAIAAADRLLAVCGPAYRESVTCQAELDHAHASCVIVMPVLRLGGYDVLPPDIARLHAVDMREVRPYEKALDELLDKLGDRTNPPAMLWGVPALPPHYLPRPDDLHEIAELVMADAIIPTAITSANQTVALQGMGGIGKSVIANAFCHDCATRRFFTNGIVWIQVGLAPQLLLLLSGVTHALGDFQDYHTEPDAAMGLRKLLVDKCCLIVLDDIWDAKHAEPFRNAIVGTRCRMLVTTRSTQIPSLLGAQEHKVGLLSEDEAVTLLEQWTGKSDLDHVVITEKLDGLPLGLRLAGALMQEGYSPQEWLATFDRVSRIALDTPSPNRDNSLDISIDLGVEAAFPESEAGRRLLYYTLGIFQEGIHIPQHVVLKLWRQIQPDLDEFVLVRIVDRLVRLALVERHEDRTITLHDLLHDYNAERLGEQTVQTHKAMLSALNLKCKPWHEIPDDGYLYDHLVYHLKESGQLDDLRGLFDSHDWMHARFAQSIYTYSGFIADVMATWQDSAHPAALRQIEAGEKPTALADCVRYALIRTSINSLASNYVPELVIRALETGLSGWSVERALAIATEVPDCKGKVKFYAALLASGLLAEEEAALAQRQAVQAALATCNAESLGSALGALAPFLVGEQWEQTLTRGLDTILAIVDETERAYALAELVGQLEGKQQKEMLTRTKIALSTEHGGVDVNVLLEAILTIGNEQRKQFDAIEQSIPAMGKLFTKLDEAKAHAYAMSRGTDIADENKAHHSTQLMLSSQEKGETLIQELETALAIEDERERVDTLAALASHLTGAQRERTLTRGLEAALAIRNVHDRADALAVLVPHFQGSILARGLEAAMTIWDPTDRIRVLAVLIPQLEEEQQAQALTHGLKAIQAIKQERCHVDALAALAPHCQDNLPTWVETILTIEDEGYRASILAALVPHLQGEELTRVLEAALPIGDEWKRARLLAALIPRLEGAQQAQALAYGLEAALAISDERDRVSALANLAPHLQHEVLAHGLEVALTIRDERDRASALSALAPHLQDELLAQGLEATLTVQEEWYRARVLVALAPQLQGELLVWGVEAALAINFEIARASALAALVPHLQDKLLVKSLEAALAIQDESACVRVLGALIPQLEVKVGLGVLASYLLRSAREKREAVLRILAIKAFVMPNDVVAAFARSVVEICWEWHWQ